MIAHQHVLRVTAHGTPAAHRELFERQQRIGGPLTIQPEYQLTVAPRQAPDPLRLTQPGNESPIRLLRRIPSSAEDVEPKAESGANGQDLKRTAPCPVLCEPQHINLTVPVNFDAGRERKTATEQQMDIDLFEPSESRLIKADVHVPVHVPSNLSSTDSEAHGHEEVTQKSVHVPVHVPPESSDTASEAHGHQKTIEKRHIRPSKKP